MAGILAEACLNLKDFWEDPGAVVASEELKKSASLASRLMERDSAVTSREGLIGELRLLRHGREALESHPSVEELGHFIQGQRNMGLHRSTEAYAECWWRCVVKCHAAATNTPWAHDATRERAEQLRLWMDMVTPNSPVPLELLKPLSDGSRRRAALRALRPHINDALGKWSTLDMCGKMGEALQLALLSREVALRVQLWIALFKDERGLQLQLVKEIQRVIRDTHWHRLSIELECMSTPRRGDEGNQHRTDIVMVDATENLMQSDALKLRRILAAEQVHVPVNFTPRSRKCYQIAFSSQDISISSDSSAAARTVMDITLGPPITNYFYDSALKYVKIIEVIQ